MLTNKLYKYPIIILMLAVIGFACSDSSTNNNDPNNQEKATVTGKVDQSSTNKALPEGTVVTMATVTASGSIETLNNVESTTTDANGNYSLSFDANTAQNFVVVAGEEGNQTMGFISSNVDNNSSVDLKPINAESSVESAIFAKVVGNGDADAVLKSDIEAIISSDIDEEVKNNSSAISKLAVAIAASAEARADFFAEEVEGNGEEKLNSSIDILVDAQAKLESDLLAATSEAEEESAVDLFLETSATAFVNAGVSEQNASQAISLWGTLVVNNMESMSEEIENDVRSQTSIMTAIALNLAVQAEAEASSMSETTQDEIASAGVTLMTEIKAALGVKADVETAFEEFQASVEESMSNDSSVEGEFIVSLNASINSETGAKTIFDNAIIAAISADAALDIFTNFTTNLFADSDEVSTGQMSETNLEAVTTIILLLNLTS
ncbi:MAG: hypothetical protein ABJK11_03045 [Balneola sp.]